MEPLPNKEHVLHACRTQPSAQHPLLEHAHQLAELHAQRRHSPLLTEIDSHRGQLIHAINHWAATISPQPHGGALMHTETLGSVVDRIALLYTHAHEILTTTGDDMHIAWARLADLAIGYEDLAYELSAGTRRLPAH
jgi:uncharacterized protein DUF4254